MMWRSVNFTPSPRKLPFWRGWHFRSKGLSHVYPRVLQLRYGSRLLTEFERFRSIHLKLSPRVSSLEELKELAPKYDAIITGSDQIWNFFCSPAYFLALGDSYQGRRIAYAPCCTQQQQPANKIPLVGRWIEDYDSISVRDDFSKVAVESASGREAKIVCDPTLLMDDSWPADSGSTSSSGNLLIYRLGPPMSGDLHHLLARIKSLSGSARIEAVVPAASNPIVCSEAEVISYDTSPLEWATKIRNCRFLITDSYHAVLFAVRYKVPFLAYYTCPGRAPRLVDIGMRLGISNRIVDCVSTAEAVLENSLTPATISQPETQEFVRESWDFLKESLT